MTSEKISAKDLREGRVAADNATTGVSRGHEEGFNKVEAHTTSPNEPADSKDTFERMQWFRFSFGEKNHRPFVDHFQRMWSDAGHPAEMVLLGETSQDMKVTLYARLPIELEDWERLGDQDLPQGLRLLVGDAIAWKTEAHAE